MRCLKIQTGAVVILAALLGAAAAFQKPEEPAGAKKSKDETPAPARVRLDVRVTVEGQNSLPQDSSVELKSDPDAPCDELGESRSRKMDGKGKVTFTNLPVCKVVLKIMITGLPTKTARVDTAKYKTTPLNIAIQTDGAVAVE